MIIIALQVWLPLNGNLNNQGLNNTAFTGSTTFEAGKIGQAGVFGTNAKRAISSDTITLNSQVTIAFWIKIKTWVNWGRIFNLYNSDKTNGISCCSNTSTDKRIGTQVYKNETKLTDSYNGSFDLNTWYHFTMVINGTTKQHYINGSLVGTATLSDSMVTTDYTVMCGGNSDGGTPVDMDINDFRVYDHALSPKEIEILARGLVLHYPLSLSGANIAPGSYAEERSYSYPSGSSLTDRWASTTNIVPSASQYVLSFWAKSTHSGDKIRAHYYSPNTTTRCETNQGTVTTASDGNIEITLSDKWEKYWIIYTQSSTTAVKHLILPRMAGPDSTHTCKGTGTVSIKLVKFEEGTIPTPWIPCATDAGYSTMGFNSTTEYDVSGYNNHGTKNGTITYSSDTARYSVSTICNGSTNQIVTPNMLLGNIWSYSIWFKSAASSRSWEAVAIMSDGGDGSTQLGFYTYPTGNRIQNSANGQFNSQISLTYDNKWHHFCGTFDGSSLKTYIDGVLKDTKSITNSLLQKSYLSIGARRKSNGTFDCYYLGSLSDFRLYATCLSAAQVAELYNTSASIANNGTLLAYEFIEN